MFQLQGIDVIEVNPLVLVSHPKGVMISMSDKFIGNSPIVDYMGIQVAPIIDKTVLSNSEKIIITQIATSHE